MRILWFTNTPSNASLEFGYNTFGGGWISSLETLIEETKIYELGICFFYQGKTLKKLKKGNTSYFGIPLQEGNVFKRILARHLANLTDEDPLYFDDVINEFKPDLIHVFGTESGYGKILMMKSNKILFHLQGLVAPYAEVYFPLGFNKFQIFRKSNLISIIKGDSIFHKYRIFKKWAIREQVIMKNWKYFAGRTDWDRNYVALINSNAHYFHCDELLRKVFFTNEWVPPSEIDRNKVITIGTTINPNTYKGLDLIYKVMGLLKDYKIQWKIFGINKENSLNQIICKILKIDSFSNNIKFYGQINAVDLVGHLKTCHFFVHPSYIDNSPNGVCEAMLLGMPVLSSSVGGIKSLIINGETGFLFNPYDKYDLAGLLVNLINNYEMAKFVGLSARQVALKRHSPDVIITDLNKIYNFIFHDNPDE